MGTFIERLQRYMRHKGINDNQLTVSCDLSVGLIGKLRKSGGGMSSTSLEKVLKCYTDLSPEWLLTGRGNMILAKDPLPTATLATKMGHGIPLIPFSAMAGAFTSEQTALENECERYVVPAFKGADFLIQVSGNSMVPTYNSGDYVACKKVPLDGLFFQWNKVYVISTVQGPLIKRIKPANTPDCVLIVSDNEEYPPFELPVSEIHGVAIVVGVIRLE
jgi:phage repressor protein C with HTH and peptisase S24 domain